LAASFTFGQRVGTMSFEIMADGLGWGPLEGYARFRPGHYEGPFNSVHPRALDRLVGGRRGDERRPLLDATVFPPTRTVSARSWPAIDRANLIFFEYLSETSLGFS
jgi:hypothetical protein